MMSFPASSNGEKQTRKSSLPKKMVATGKELLTVNEELISASDKKKISELRVPVPKREYERLTILRQCNLLDTAADQAYDRFSALCARYFKVRVFPNDNVRYLYILLNLSLRRRLRLWLYLLWTQTDSGSNPESVSRQNKLPAT